MLQRAVDTCRSLLCFIAYVGLSPYVFVFFVCYVSIQIVWRRDTMLQRAVDTCRSLLYIVDCVGLFSYI